MKIVGLITEYNPFHNGHKYHIEMAKKITGADAVIAVMSGNYVQRGTPAIIPKHLRCLAALQNGVDMVVELPSLYALGSAELFAFGAVSLLDSLGCVDALCFGSECGNIGPLWEAASILADEPQKYRENLRSHLKSGLSFPAARAKALSSCLGKDFSETSLLGTSNNILAVEYLKALIRRKSNITPCTIKRVGSEYREAFLEGTFSSATSIRNFLKEHDPRSHLDDKLSLYIPQNCLPLIENGYGLRFPVFEEDFSLLLRYRLLEEDAESLQRYVDVTSDIAHRIARCSPKFISFHQFCQVLKTKEITYTRICRILFHILLKITKEEEKESQLFPHRFVRILGLRKEKQNLFTILKSKGSLPLLTNPPRYSSLSFGAAQAAVREMKRDALYESVITDKFKTSFSIPIKQQMVIL